MIVTWFWDVVPYCLVIYSQFRRMKVTGSSERLVEQKKKRLHDVAYRKRVFFTANRYGNLKQRWLLNFYMLQEHNSGLGHLIIKISRSHTIRHIPGIIPLNEQSACRRGCYVHNTQQTVQTTFHAVSGIWTGDPAIKRLQTSALDRTATWLGWLLIYIYVSYIPAGEFLL